MSDGPVTAVEAFCAEIAELEDRLAAAEERAERAERENERLLAIARAAEHAHEINRRPSMYDLAEWNDAISALGRALAALDAAGAGSGGSNT